MDTSSTTHSSALRGKEGVCRIEVARVGWVTTQPWQRAAQSKSSGTGFCIQGKRLLTNAHVVRSAVDIRVRPHGSTRRFLAKVVVYAPDVDLALLEIEGDEERAAFFKDDDDDDETNHDDDGDENGEPSSKRVKSRDKMALEFAEDLPKLQESVHVVGYPTGGRTICITEGVVSRIDLVACSAWNNMLAIQIDAAINPGNSGGPAFNSAGQVTGVAFFKNVRKDTDSIGYLIPADVVRTFLGRCGADGTYTLSPSLPYRWHALENKSLRLAHKVPGNVHGILLTTVSNTLDGALHEGDVLTKIDDKTVADDGQVVLRGDELIQHSYLLLGKRVDEPTTFSVYRDGQHVDCPFSYVLGDIPSICVRWPHVDYEPDYLILGTLVLLPLSWDLRSSKKCGTRLIGDCIDWSRKWPSEWEGKEGLVVLTDIMAHELSFSYSRPWRRVVAYNGTPVLSLKHLRDMWEASCVAATEDPPTFARIELENDDDVVFEVKAAIEAQKDILETHQIRKPWHISPTNPKYR
jgi:S1-C subfamily serine protease